jgi:hypothetical protein
MSSLFDTTTTTGTTTVPAENPPLGVQLWPTLSPALAPDFTLESVTVYRRRASGDYVLWTFESGQTRRFDIGDMVAVQLPA